MNPLPAMVLTTPPTPHLPVRWREAWFLVADADVAALLERGVLPFNATEAWRAVSADFADAGVTIERIRVTSSRANGVDWYVVEAIAGAEFLPPLHPAASGTGEVCAAVHTRLTTTPLV